MFGIFYLDYDIVSVLCDNFSKAFFKLSSDCITGIRTNSWSYQRIL